MRHTKKQESIAHKQEKKKSTATVLEETQILDSLDKYFKYVQIIKWNIYKELKKSLRMLSPQIENIKR